MCERGCFKRSLLLIEATEALYCLHQHEHQLMVWKLHLSSQLLPTIRQLRAVAERGKKNKLFLQKPNFCWNVTDS